MLNNPAFPDVVLAAPVGEADGAAVPVVVVCPAFPEPPGVAVLLVPPPDGDGVGLFSEAEPPPPPFCESIIVT